MRLFRIIALWFVLALLAAPPTAADALKGVALVVGESKYTGLPALANPFGWIYKKAILDTDPRWYEKNILGSGPFKFDSYEIGQSIKGVRNPDYYHQGLPYLDGFTAIYADKQAVRVDAIRADRAATEFRGMLVTHRGTA